MRLIDADELKMAFPTCDNSKRILIASVRATINHMPTIERRAKGKWVYGEHEVAMCDGYRCNHCGFFIPWDYKYTFIDFIKNYYFCPRCGADMKGNEQND